MCMVVIKHTLHQPLTWICSHSSETLSNALTLNHIRNHLCRFLFFTAKKQHQLPCFWLLLAQNQNFTFLLTDLTGLTSVSLKWYWCHFLTLLCHYNYNCTSTNKHYNHSRCVGPKMVNTFHSCFWCINLPLHGGVRWNTQITKLFPLKMRTFLLFNYCFQPNCFCNFILVITWNRLHDGRVIYPLLNH